MLRSLCIYETVPEEQGLDCLDLMEARSLPPEGMHPDLLKGSQLVIPGSSYEAHVLEQYLGISRMTQASFLLDIILPRSSSLIIP